MKKEKRTNMKPEERRNQLLDCAQMLFFSKGFEDTTMQDILASAGVSKGGFYHHFKSKDELLEGILNRFVEQTQTALRPVLEQEYPTWLDLYHAYFDVLRAQMSDGARARLPLFVMMFQDRNAALQQRMSDAIYIANLEIFAEVLQRGVRSGDLDLPDAEVAAGLALKIGTTHQDWMRKALRSTDLSELVTTGQKIDISLQLQGIAIDRMLGLPDGNTCIRADGFADDITAGIKDLLFDEDGQLK
ncbi:TetR/AcrR family transcriptional regulator [Pacificoceanicola onchidii]|uniref:TetR/AcrR family transcriptional regulator n=1 Tax=Pacificoceanicola onchidii TaxID=2562685 RepID=UPI0010A63663|nr:TetR/AcrR family transcriptional regulator [Pacificoceanicola onchidii]